MLSSAKSTLTTFFEVRHLVLSCVRRHIVYTLHFDLR